jgi:hypothetical protein
MRQDFSPSYPENIAIMSTEKKTLDRADITNADTEAVSIWWFWFYWWIPD